jgi:hypothetical protein
MFQQDVPNIKPAHCADGHFPSSVTTESLKGGVLVGCHSSLDDGGANLFGQACIVKHWMRSLPGCKVDM